MKPTLLTLLLLLLNFHHLSAQCQIITLPYGQVQIDINRGYKIIPTQDSNFVIAGEWNSEAFLLKVNAQGQQLALKKYGSAIGGQSEFADVVQAPDGGFVAVGHCDNCTVPNDSLRKVVAIKTDADLNLDATIGVKKFGSVTTSGGFTTANRRAAPVLVRDANAYFMAASVTVGLGLNWEDVVVTKLTNSLGTVWEKLRHIGYFEAPTDIVATNDGFLMPVALAFVPNQALLKIDKDGEQLWFKHFAADAVRGITYLSATNETVVIGDRTPSGQAKQAFLMQFNAATGAPQDSLLFGDNLDDFGYEVQTLPNGDLLTGIVTDRPNPFGIYASSRIYRIKTNPLAVNCYYLVPNPDNITNMSVRSIVPLSENGKDFTVTGIRGLYNRTFFHTRHDCEVTEASTTICPGDTYTLPDGIIVSAAGTYNSTLLAVNGCDSIVQTTLSVYPPTPPTVVNATICSGKTYILPNGIVVSVAGTYNTTLSAMNGCDSVIQTILNLFVPIPPTFINVALCPGESHTLPNGQVVSAAGVYDVTLFASNGCDSLVQTTVMILPSSTTEVSVGLCPGETYTLPTGQVVSAPGIYEVTLSASNGCDSVILTTVEGLMSSINVVDVDLCPGETYTLPNGQVVNTAGIYDVKYIAINGCDSIVRTVVESLDTPPTLIVDVIVCAGSYFVLPNGDTTSTPGDYPFPYTAPNGCEGIQIIGLSFFPPIEVDSVVIKNDNGQNSGSISLSGVSGGSGIGYQYFWNNSATGATIDSLPFGTYQVTIADLAGCTAIFSYVVDTIVGINDPSENVSFRLSPNPFSDQIQVTLEVKNVSDANFEIRLSDAWGRHLKTLSLSTGGTQTFNTGDLPVGVYFVQLLENERLMLSRQVIKH